MINDHLSISDLGLDLLKEIIEKLSLAPYDDQTGKRISQWCKGATIGYGHLISRDEWDRYRQGITETQADDILQSDLQPAIDAVRRAVIIPLQQNQFDALVIFAFNIGGTGLRASSAIKMINDPRVVTPYPTLEKAWKAWDDHGNKGVINRRACEWDIYSKGVYKGW